MAPAFASWTRTGWLVNLAILLLLIPFAWCLYLLWDRRIPWAVAQTLHGALPDHCGPHSTAVYVHDVDKGRMFFPDTKRWLLIPKEQVPGFQIEEMSASRRFARFTDRSAATEPERYRRRLWDFDTGREIPIPEFAADDDPPLPEGDRLFLMGLEWGKPRRFQVRRLDGSVISDLVLPAVQKPGPGGWERARDPEPSFTSEGRFLVERVRTKTSIVRVRIHEMAGGGHWEFGDECLGISDEGVAVISQGTVTARDLRSGKELWNAPIVGGALEARFLAPDRLLLRRMDKSLVVLDAATGRLVVELENSAGNDDPLFWFQMLEGAPRPILQSMNLWDFETGRRLPLTRGNVYPLAVFPDGRRVLRPDYSGHAEVCDLETGRTLFRFGDGTLGPGRVSYARLSGDRVLAYSSKDWGEVQLWERRHPEGRWGHLQRPELLGAVFLGAVLLVLWTHRPVPVPPPA